MQAGDRSWFLGSFAAQRNRNMVSSWHGGGRSGGGQLVRGEKGRLAGPCPRVGEWGGDLTPRQRAGLGDRKAGVVVAGGGVCRALLCRLPFS